MNIFKKVYCRAFQTVFRLAIPFLPYREPEILNGVEELAALLKDKNVRAALLVTDAGIRKAGITAPLEELLEKNGVRVAVYDGTRANPTAANVEEARELYMREICECLFAVGGGF